MLGEFLLIAIDGVLQALIVIGVEFEWFTVRLPFGRRDAASAPLAGVGLFLVGAAIGGLSLWIWPYRLTAAGPIHGASLIMSPLLNGLVMDTFGRWRRRRGQPANHAATFWGGALFAFGMAGVRFWLMRAY
jgi:hypothetical protein